MPRLRLDPTSPSGVSVDSGETKIQRIVSAVPRLQTLDDLQDVIVASTPSDDQALAYDTATGKWIPQTLAGGGGGSAPDATTLVKGIVQLAGDLGGTAALPTVKSRTVTKTVGFTNADYTVDGIADQEQIQQAIDAVSAAGGGTVHIRSGTYNIVPVTSQTYALKPKSNVHLMGEGINRTILRADATADIRRVFFNDGLTVGEEFVENFILSDMTVDMNSRQSMGLEVRRFRNWTQYNIEWKNILCIGIGGASRWATKFGTIVPGDVEGTKSEGLNIYNCWYHDNFCRTFEVVLCTNVRGGTIHHNKFENNSSLAPNYDEVSLFIYNDDIDFHDNYSYNSKYHGVGTKESFRTKIHDNIIVKDELWDSNYIGIRAWNTRDCDISNNTVIFPDVVSIVGNITNTNDPVTLYPGEWNQIIIATTTTITLTDGSTTADMYRGQPIYGTSLPEGTTVLSVDSSSTFRVNKTAAGGLGTGLSFKLSHLSIGVTHADRNIGYDGHTLRNEYTKNLTIKNNKFRNVYYGVQSGASSLGIDTNADANILGTAITLTEARYTIEGVEYTVTSPGEMSIYIEIGYKITGTGIPLNTRIVAVDSTTGVLTVDNTCTTGSNILVTIDSNTIAYRHENINISDNQFDGVFRNAVRWGLNNFDTDITRFYVRNNIVGPWYGTGGDAIMLIGYSTNASLFNEVYIENNIVGANLEGTNNGGISISGLIASRIKSNVIPSSGTRGRIKLYSNAIVNDFQDNWVTKTASYTLIHGDENIMVDATSGIITIAPPEPIYHFGKEYLITKSDASSNSVTINPTGVHTINGTTNYDLTTQYQSARIKSDGTQWLVIGVTGVSIPTLQQAFNAGNSITVSNTVNKSLTYTNSDVTNNPDTVVFTNAGTGFGLRVNQNGVLASNKYGIFLDSNAIQTTSELIRIRQQNSSSTVGPVAILNSGTGLTVALSDATSNVFTVARDGGVVVNERGLDTDTRIEGITDQNLIFLDASTDRIGMGTSTPTVKLDVVGEIRTSTVGSNVSSVVTVGGTQTLTNKTLSSPVINTPTGIVKADVGLANVDNTADTAKPVSTVQQTALNLKANLASPAFTGVVTVPSPTNATDASTKAYVDSVATGLDVKASVRLATNNNHVLATPGTIDSITLATNDRVLLKNQTTVAENGIYIFNGTALVRATDADTNAEVTSGMFTFVSEGVVNAGRGFTLNTADPIILGTTALSFSQFSSAGTGVTSVSVVSANGLTGTVATATTTPAITLSTTVTGITKGNGTALSAAVAGTDYQIPVTLTTTGTSGVATFTAGALNIPNYTTTADMVLATAQTNSGAKTFLDTTMQLRNVANTFNGSFVNTNTANRVYTLKDAAGTVAFTSDITGTNSGTNTGDNATNSQYSGLVSNATHTGDATGATALTLATVNANIGAFGTATQVATPTVNAKGLVTAISNTTIAIPTTAITDFAAGVAATASVTANTAKVTNATHTGDVTGDTVLTIAANAVINADLAQMATKTYKGRTTAATGNAEDVPVATLKTDLVLVKADVGLADVDNTSDATKNAATTTLTNKTLDATSLGDKLLDGFRKRPFLYSDFLTVSTTASDPFLGVLIASGTIGTPTAGNVTANHPGAVRFVSSTTTNSGVFLGSNTAQFLLGGGEIMECIFRLETLTTSTFRMGFLDTATSADAVDGCYLEILSTGVATGKTSSNSTRSSTATTTTLATATFYRLRVTVTSTTSVTFGIFDDSGASVWTNSLTTNIPSASGRETGVGVVATNSAVVATGLLHLDYMAVTWSSDRTR